MLKSSEKGGGKVAVHRITHAEMLMISKSSEQGRGNSDSPGGGQSDPKADIYRLPFSAR